MPDNSHLHAGPRVEVAAYRDPDDLTVIEVFVNGIKVDAHTDVVDPGRGYPYALTEWRSRASGIGWGAGSDAWKRAVIGWYIHAEDDYTTNDMTTAADAQPGVEDIELLDPNMWVGDGVLSAAQAGPGLVADNTIQAGWALFAVKAFHHRLSAHEQMPGLRDPARLVPVTVRLYEAANDAVGAYAQLTMPGAGPGDLPAAVRDLLTDLHHLADAKNICLAMPPEPGRPVALDTLIHGLVAHLRIAGPAWAEGLRNDPTGPYEPGELANFPELLEAAYRRYQNDVLGAQY